MKTPPSGWLRPSSSSPPHGHHPSTTTTSTTTSSFAISGPRIVDLHAFVLASPPMDEWLDHAYTTPTLRTLLSLALWQLHCGLSIRPSFTVGTVGGSAFLGRLHLLLRVCPSFLCLDDPSVTSSYISILQLRLQRFSSDGLYVTGIQGLLPRYHLWVSPLDSPHALSRQRPCFVCPYRLSFFTAFLGPAPKVPARLSCGSGSSAEDALPDVLAVPLVCSDP